AILSFFLTRITSFKLILFCFNRGYEVEEIFKQLYLATSFQDFWGRRWNRYSSKMLRLAIYDPILETLLKILPTVNTFVVSAIMHELIFYYITCGLKPSCEVMWFFVLQGFCISSERMFQAGSAQYQSSFMGHEAYLGRA
uniref:Acyl-CoA--sterol O-acyltransferase 1-like n=1 Tax=Nicotiana tabacum TaxID=4097 RepID=A0A1S3ZG48_TOBAC